MSRGSPQRRKHTCRPKYALRIPTDAWCAVVFVHMQSVTARTGGGHSERVEGGAGDGGGKGAHDRLRREGEVRTAAAWGEGGEVGGIRNPPKSGSLQHYF